MKRSKWVRGLIEMAIMMTIPAQASAAAVDLTHGGRGHWDVYYAVDVQDWSGSKLFFTSQAQRGDLYDVSGYFDWRTTNGASYGREHFVGTFDPLQRTLCVTGQYLENAGGWIGLATYTANVDPNGMLLYNGAWPSGNWAARYVSEPNVTSPCGQTLANGLVACYPFNGNANDESGKGNHGLVHGAVLTQDRFGRPNSAYYLDGVDDYISASGGDLPTAERTTALWFLADTLETKPVFMGYGGGACGTSWMMGVQPGAPWRCMYMSSHCNNNTIMYAYTEPPIGMWHHFVVTTSPTGTELYVDGELKAANDNYVKNTTVTNTDLSFGVTVSAGGKAPYTDGNVGYFKGAIDDVHIYDRALSDDEIAALANLQDGCATAKVLVLDISATSGGTVTPSPGRHTYSCGEQVPVCATPEDCNHFTGWTGTAVDAGRVVDPAAPCTTVTMDGDYTLIANFEVKRHCLTITATQGGRVIAEPGGTVEPNETRTFCYNCGDTVEIMAQPDPNHHFGGWAGGAVDPNSSYHITIPVTSDVNIVSQFDENNLNSGSTPGGSIIYPGGRPRAPDCRIPVHVIAKPDPCYHFTHWSGTAVDASKVADANAPDTWVTVDADYTLIAHFAPDGPKTLTVSSSNGGTVTSPGMGPFQYDCGTSVPIAASADACCKFAGWTGTAVEAGKVANATSPDTTVLVDRDYTLQATFEQYAMLPQVKTIGVEDVTSVSARLMGTLISDGGVVCEWRFRYWRTGQAEQSTDWVPGAETDEAFKKLVEDLVPLSGYCFEAEARNCAGTAKGGELCFTTPACVRLTLSSTAAGRIVEPNVPVVELPAPADVNVVAEADPNCFFWCWQGTVVEGGKLRTDRTEPNTRVLVDANDTLRAAFLRWIVDWADDVGCEVCRGARGSTSQLWDFADAVIDVNGIPEGIRDILGPAPNGQPPVPGTVLTCEDPNLPGAQRWWPADPYEASGRRGLVASTGLEASINIPASLAGTSVWLQVVWREYGGVEPGLFPPDTPYRPILTCAERSSNVYVTAEFDLQYGWHHTTYVWLVGADTQIVRFNIGGPILMDSLIVDTCPEGWGRWVEP